MEHCSCCENKGEALAQLRQRHSRVLYIALALNAAMFLIEMAAGLMAHSTSLVADSLDMLGDAFIYGFSVFVLTRSTRWQAGAAMAKGAFMLLFGMGAVADAVGKILHPVLPDIQIMSIVGTLALAANTACFLLLYRHRDDNINMSSTWLCSRNDLLANLGVLAAALGTALSTSRWPDIAVGLAIATLFVSSALRVLVQAIASWQTAATD